MIYVYIAIAKDFKPVIGYHLYIYVYYNKCIYLYIVLILYYRYLRIFQFIDFFFFVFRRPITHRRHLIFI